MDKIKAFFRTDEEYTDMIKIYRPRDGALAIIIYILVMVLYHIMGVLYAEKNLYLGYQINFFLAVLCIVCALFRKQSIATLGFTKKNLFKSIFLGLALSAVLFIVNLAIGISGKYSFNAIQILIKNFLYYFFVIALVEEIIFRGFIQTRIYGIIKNPVWAVILTGFMFMSVHVPFQMYAVNMGMTAYIESHYVNLISTMVWHVVFNFMYMKYNSIAAPTVFHGIMDWCNVLFIN